jgi:hypothetical protein
MLGTVLSHDYVTGLYINNDVAMPDGLKLWQREEMPREEGSIQNQTSTGLRIDR